MINVKNLSKSFYQAETKIEAVNKVSFSVKKGESVAIVGTSGSGKSTLLSLIAGLEKSDSGTVCLANKDITKMNESQLAKFRSENCGIIFQQFHLFPHLSAFENVKMPLIISGHHDSSSMLANEALKKVGLAERAHHLPGQLSGGEQQRVAIARAFIAQPQIILADEPSGNLDKDTGMKVMDMLFQQVQANKATLLLITHDMVLAKSCDRILEISNGIIET